MQTLRTSAKTGEGMSAHVAILEARRAAMPATVQ